MTIDLVSFGEHVLVLAAVAAVCVVIDLYGRILTGWGTVVLFCLGEYGWALLAGFLWLILNDIHRAEMFRLRILRIYNGTWID
jgi:hypothetical protein